MTGAQAPYQVAETTPGDDLAAQDLDEIAQQLTRRLGPAPGWALVLGSGLGPVAEQLGVEERLPYGAVGLPDTGVAGHAGTIGISTTTRARVAVLAGRVHVYEGKPAAEVVCTVRALARWGVQRVVFTSAVGSLDPAIPPGSLVRVTDHLNLMGWNPLVGDNDGEVGPRFPDLSTAYSPALGARLDVLAADLGVELRRGVYAGMSGPSYETPAEIRMLQILGATVVGMSLVPEVIASVHAGLEVAALAVVSNLGAGLGEDALDHGDVTATVAPCAEAVSRLVSALVAETP